MNKKAVKDTIHHDVAGIDILAKQDERFREYRRRWEDNPLRLSPGDFPLHIDIEVTASCNLKCPFCATTYSEFPKGIMKWEVAKKILDEAGAQGLCACKFNFRGEPLLHKDLGKIIQYAKSKGIIDVFFNTNAALLTEERARMLIESGLDRLTVSFEGSEPAVYEQSRVGAKFDEVVQNVVRLRDLRDSMGKETPKVRVQAVMTPRMEGKLDQYIQFWRDKVDQVSYNEMEPSVDSVLHKIRHVQSSWICPFPYQRLTIMFDGTITACKNDYYGKLAFGNINDVSIKEVWTKRLEPLRTLHREGKTHEIEACGECPLRMSELQQRNEI